MEESKPANEPAKQEQKRSPVWEFAKVAVPVVASIISLAISALTYWDTHRADVLSAQAAQQAYANKVSYWITGSGAKARFVIQNLGLAPISDVVVVASSYFSDLKGGYGVDENLEAFLNIGTLPPCSVMTTDVLQAAHTDMIQSPGSMYATDGHLIYVPGFEVTGPISPVAINAIVFNDANGLTWTRDNQGLLENGFYSNVIPILYPPHYLSNPVNGGSVTAANGCS